MDTDAVTIATAQGEGQAQLIRSFLASFGIPSALAGEALRLTHGFTLDGLGEVRIEVSRAHAERARELLDRVEAGEMAIDDDFVPPDAGPDREPDPST